MPRPKGSKDRKPRRIMPGSLRNLKPYQTQETISLRLPVKLSRKDANHWAAMSPEARGAVVAGYVKSKEDEVRAALSDPSYIYHSDPRQAQGIIDTPIPEDEDILRGDVP